MQETLVGLTLTGVTLAKGTTGFELSGARDGSSHRFSLSTMYQVCFSREDIFERDIINDPSSLKIWEILEHNVKAIQLNQDERYCEIHFEDAPSIFIWSADLDHDNLLVVTNMNSDEWFTIG